MGGEWKTERLGGLCTKIGSGATPRGGDSVYKSSGVSLIRSQNVYNGGFHRDGLAFIDEIQADALSNVEIQPNDVLLNITGDSVARSCQVPDGLLPARVNQHVAIIRPKSSQLHHRFLRYVLVESRMQNRLLSLAGSGATRNALTKGMIEDLDVPLPPLPIQHAIAEILGSLDDKIELNRRTNETLEAMARAVFKSWFVDFDPVHAKSKGRKPDGMDAETAKLFPSSFVDSEIGRVPKGWKPGTFGDVASSRRDIVDVGDFPPETAYIGLEHIPRRSIALSEWGDASAVESAKSRFTTGDVLFGKLRPYFHKVGIAPVDGVCSTDILVIVPKRAEWSAFILGHASSNEMVDYADGCSTGTRMPRVSWGDLSRYPLPIPPPEVAGHLAHTLAPLLDATAANIHECRSLRLCRDALLPRLLSGELAVPTSKVS